MLYLTFALIFAWLYRLLAQTIPGCFSGLTFRPGELGSLSSFIYFSLTVLTTVGFGDITPVNDFVRNLAMLEAPLGQLYPAVILARLLTLYADDRTTGQHRARLECAPPLPILSKVAAPLLSTHSGGSRAIRPRTADCNPLLTFTPRFYQALPALARGRVSRK